MTTNLQTSLSCAEWANVKNAHSAIHGVGQNIWPVRTEHHPCHCVRVATDFCDNGVFSEVPDLDHVVNAGAHHLAGVLVETHWRHLKRERLKSRHKNNQTNLVGWVQAGQRLTATPVPNFDLQSCDIIEWVFNLKDFYLQLTWQSSPPETTRGLLPLEQSTLLTKLVWPFILLILSPVHVSQTPTWFAVWWRRTHWPLCYPIWVCWQCRWYPHLNLVYFNLF